MYKIDLITEQEIKNSGMLDKNVLSAYILSAIELAQDQGLQPLIGTKLYEALRNETLDLDQDKYSILLEKVKLYLKYQVISVIQVPLSFKNRNAGVIQANDVNYGTNPLDDIQHLAKYYYDKARFYGNQLTKWLDSANIPEYKSADKSDIKANSLSYDTGINLKKRKDCKGEIVGTKENIEALLKKIQLLEAEVEMLKESVEPLQAEVLQLRTENNQLRTTINNLNNTIAQKESIIISQQQTIANLSSLDVDDIIDKLDNIDARVDSVGTKVTTIDNKVALQGTDNTATNTATYERIGDVEDIINHLNNIQL